MNTIGEIVGEKLKNKKPENDSTSDPYLTEIEKMRLELSTEIDISPSLKDKIIKRLQKYLEGAMGTAVTMKRILEMEYDKKKKEGKLTKEEENHYKSKIKKEGDNISKLEAYKLELRERKNISNMEKRKNNNPTLGGRPINNSGYRNPEDILLDPRFTPEEAKQRLQSYIDLVGKIPNKVSSENKEKISSDEKAKIKDAAKAFFNNPNAGLTGDNKDVAEKFSAEFKHELLMLYKGKMSTEALRNKIAEAEFKHEKLSAEDEVAKMLLLSEAGETDKIKAIVTKFETEKTEKEVKENKDKEDGEALTEIITNKLISGKKLKKDEQEFYNKNKTKIDEAVDDINELNDEKTQENIERISNRIIAGSTLNATDQQLLKKYESEILEVIKVKKESEDQAIQKRTAIAEAELDGNTLNTDQNIRLMIPGERDKVDAIKTTLEAERAEVDNVAEKLAAGTALTTLEKDFYKKNKNTVDARLDHFKEIEDEKIKSIIDRISNRIVVGSALNAADQQLLKKYNAEILEQVKEKKTAQENSIKNRNEIALAELDGKTLTTEQEVFLLLPNERAEIDAEKTRIQNERNAETAVVNALAEERALTPAEQAIYDKNKAAIDAKVPKAKENLLNTRKTSIIEKLSEASATSPAALTAEEQKVYDANKTELDAKIVDALKTKLAAARSVNDIDLVNKYEATINARIRSVENARANYGPLAQRLERLQNDEVYKKLSSRNDLSPAEQAQLADLKREEQEINNALDALGPAAKHFANLDRNRNELAKATQEFKKTFKSKFFGAKVLGVFAGMFGSKWSAVKETDASAAAQKNMNAKQASYDEVRRALMNIQMDEEHQVRAAFGQTREQMVADPRLQAFIDGITEDLVIQERHRLDALNREMEGTVRGSAMQRFGRWYSKDFMNFGPFKGEKNKVARNVMKRIVSGTILSAAMLPFVGAGAGLATFFGYRALRAGISGTVGESMAAGLAHGVGGNLTANNRFENFEAKTVEELRPMVANVRQEMFNRITAGEKPVVSSSLMNYINAEENKANNNYLRREGNLRRGEMWTRLIAGGLTGYAMTQLIPNPVVVPGPGPGPTPVPNPDNFSVQGDFINASPKGFINDFMELKKEMIAHYHGMGHGGYADASKFAGLSDDQVVEKLLATGKFDPFTADIMKAHSLEDFMKVAQEHGFWKPEGWGNSGIDSGSIPAGSIMGMESGSNGMMHFYMQLPDGTKIPIDNNFQEALNQHLSNVKMINADHITDHTNHGGAPVSADSHLDNGNKLSLSGNEPKQGLLDDKAEAGHTAVEDPGKTNSLTDKLSEKINNVDKNAPDAIDQKISLYKQYTNPGSEGDFYRSRGLDVMGKELGTQGQITQVNDGTISYYAKGYEHLARGNGDWRPLEDASFYKEYHTLHDNYLDAQEQIKTLEAEKIKLKIDALQDNEPSSASENIDNTPKAATSIETKITPETPEQHTDKLVDQIYGHDTAMGHESGVDSEEWQKVKDMSANKFLRNYRTNIDDTYANTKYDIPEQNKFADTILEKAEKYNMKPKAGGLFSKAETLEHFVDRLSKAELENKIQSSK